MQIEKLFNGEGKVVGTVICGDGYYSEHTDQARTECLEMIKGLQPDIPLCRSRIQRRKIRLRLRRYRSNCRRGAQHSHSHCNVSRKPGVELYSKKTFIAITSDSARGMAKPFPQWSGIRTKLLKGEKMGPARLEGYIHRGIRKSFFHEKSGAERAVEMLLAKLKVRVSVQSTRCRSSTRYRLQLLLRTSRPQL